jgi:hypothetical protein
MLVLNLSCERAVEARVWIYKHAMVYTSAKLHLQDKM